LFMKSFQGYDLTPKIFWNGSYLLDPDGGRHGLVQAGWESAPPCIAHLSIVILNSGLKKLKLLK
jgi:hypothetical protein